MSFEKKGRAGFVFKPRRLDEVLEPASPLEEKNYQVVQKIALEKITYENFVSDMVVARDFLEMPDQQAMDDDDLKCLLIFSPGVKGEVLVAANEKGFVRYAAYCRE